MCGGMRKVVGLVRQDRRLGDSYKRNDAVGFEAFLNPGTFDSRRIN